MFMRRWYRKVKVRYTYEQAQQMVLDAVAPLGEDYVRMVRRAFAERWIDVYPNKARAAARILPAPTIPTPIS